MIVALVVLSAFLHALWNALLRLEANKDLALVAATLFATLFAAVVASASWFLGEAPFAAGAGVGYSAIAGVCEAAYFATLAAALARGTLGTVYTISRGGALLVVWPLSMLLFAEVATPSSLAGSGLVLGGLVLCGLCLRGGSRGGDRQAVGWAVVCAASIAGYHLAYTAALDHGAQAPGCFALALGVAVAINAARLRGAERAALGPLIRRRWPRLVVIGLVCAGSFLLLLEALQGGGAAFVMTLRNTSVLFAAAMAWWIGERPTRGTLAGAALVAIGAAVMAW